MKKTIPIRDYLGSVLPGLANRPISETAQAGKDYPRCDLGFAKLRTTARSSAGSTGFARWF
jgi:hypothetical protein